MPILSGGRKTRRGRCAAPERRAPTCPIDWENVAEEIESFGKSQARELASRIGIILVHLLKPQASPAAEPRAGWREAIVEQRNEISRLLGFTEPAAED